MKKVIVITGGARGIGAALAERLHQRGARVALVGLEEELLAQVAARCGDAHWARCDVSDREQVDAAVDEAAAALGGLDVVVANAGIGAQLPLVGNILKWYVPILGALLVMISSNSGVFGASRIAYSMGKLQLLPSWFQITNPKTKTPSQTIVFFSGIAAIVLVIAYLQGPHAFDFLGDLYAFGASLSYTLVFVALITLRFTDSAAPRRFKMPWNIPMTIRGKRGDVSIVSIIGFIGIFLILIFTLATHPTGRIAGPSWVIFGVLFYIVYRTRTRKPVFDSLDRDWVKHHQRTLAGAGELEMLDEYNAALKKQGS